jgi:hypothetical protein
MTGRGFFGGMTRAAALDVMTVWVVQRHSISPLGSKNNKQVMMISNIVSPNSALLSPIYSGERR